LVADTRDALTRIVATIIDRLCELGYVVGRNVRLDFRHADSEEYFRELATAFLGAGVQVIFAQGPYALRAARAVTATVPKSLRVQAQITE
jgi:hypothetical protein